MSTDFQDGLDTHFSKPWDAAKTRLLSERWQQILEEVGTLANESGRSRDAVEVLPVTKMQPDQAIQVLLDLGQRRFAENRPQEIVRRAQLFTAALDGPQIEWILIGQLQRNKARDVARYASGFESLSSLRVAEAVNRRLETIQDTHAQTVEDSESTSDAASPLPVLIQVNASGEPQKSGVSVEMAPLLVDQLSELPHLDIQGFMTMAPHTDDEGVIRETFATVRNLRDRLRPEWTGRFDLEKLSLGMSHDYPLAIAEGSTQVRLGTAIFGERTYPKR